VITHGGWIYNQEGGGFDEISLEGTLGATKEGRQL